MSKMPTVSERVRGRAALAPQDMADSKRGRPDTDLSAYAAERGLQYIGSQNPSGYFAAVPGEEELQFNVVRGMRGDRDACLWHWRYPWPAHDNGDMGPGGFYAKIWKGNWRRIFTRDFSYSAADHSFVAVPCTGAATLAPELSILPALRIDNWDRHFLGTPRDFPLKDRGLPGFTYTREGELLPDEILDALIGSRAGDVLRAGSRFALFQLRYRFGTLILRRNGYARGDRDLDELLDGVCAAADALAGICAPLYAPQPFAEPLPAADWPESEPSWGRPWPPSPIIERVHALARHHGATLEEPLQYHRAFPRNPVPGTAMAVMRGSFGGIPPTARLALHNELPVQDRNSGRTALLLPAGEAAETVPGGVPVPHDGDPMRYAVRDGIFAVWILRWRPGGDLGDIDALLDRGVAVAREAGAL